MIKFANFKNFEYLDDIKNLLQNSNIIECLTNEDFTELYEILNSSVKTQLIIGEFTKFLYASLNIDILKNLKEVPKSFLIFTNALEIEIPNHITTINERAFGYNLILFKVKMPSNLQILRKLCFTGCHNLKEVELPKTLQIIEDIPFQNGINIIKYNGTFEEFLQIKGNENLFNCNFVCHKNLLLKHRQIPRRTYDTFQSLYLAYKAICQ